MGECEISDIINLRGSYFGIVNPLQIFDRWLHRYVHSDQVRLNNKELYVEWTDRAQRELDQITNPLIVEMQLYFSCVVKKRVLFHQQVDFDTAAVNEQIQLAFRSVESDACSPEVFARDFPEARELNAVSGKMMPNRVSIDFKAGVWIGEFGY